MTTTQARHDTLGEATLGELAEGLRGELVRPSDPSYDEARSIWNAAHDKRPALIVRCRGVADVIRAVEFARSEGLTLAVRGGGHSIPGFSTTDGGLVIDLSPMNAVRIDPGPAPDRGARRLRLGRRRRRGAGFRAGGHRWPRVHDRRRGLHPRRRDRLAGPPGRTRLRQPHRRRHRHRRRSVPAHQ